MAKRNLESLLTEIESLAYPDLRARYQEAFRRAPAPRLGQDLLRRALAYQTQADRLGALSPKTDRLLRAHGKPQTQNGSRDLVPGSQLVREWQGDMHIVEVVNGGFRWHGERYSSLSAIAREITGTRWSGPRFFGLTENGGK